MLLYISSSNSTSGRGKWACSSQIGAMPPGQKCIVAAARERLSVCVRPGLHLVEWTRHNMDSSQIVAAYKRTSTWVPGGAISHFGLFKIRMLFGKKWPRQGKKILFCIFKII